MKKSKSIRLALLGSTSFALVACDEAPPTDARFYANVDECAAIHGKASCEDAFKTSQATFAAEAPQYTKKEECEAEFGAGNCETQTTATSGGGMGSFFMPMMMGYMMGNAFSRPVYRGPDNSATMRSGGKTYNVGAFAGNGRAAAFRSAPVSEVARGGLGNRAAAYRTSAGS